MGVDSQLVLEAPADCDVLKLAADLAERFSVVWTNDDGPCVVPWEDYEYREPDDLVPITTTAGGRCLVVHMFCRYYGPGYERGPAIELLVLFRYLRSRGIVPWYGPDHDDEYSEVDDQFEADFFDHFAEHGSRPYEQLYGVGPKDPLYKRPMVKYGMGHGLKLYRALGSDYWAAVRESDGAVVVSMDSCKDRFAKALELIQDADPVVAEGKR